jgi:hypothetical protein
MIDFLKRQKKNYTKMSIMSMHKKEIPHIHNSGYNYLVSEKKRFEISPN